MPTTPTRRRRPSVSSSYSLTILFAPTVLLLLLFFVVCMAPAANAQECTADGTQCDTHERCQHWAMVDDECVRNRAYMREHCPAQCQTLAQDLQEAKQRQAAAVELKVVTDGEESKKSGGGDDGDGSTKQGKACSDFHKHCTQWADLGECEANMGDMHQWCPKACGVCTAIAGEGGDSEDEDEYDETCKDTHENCQFWADAGECAANPNYMLQGCKRACKACEKKVKKESASSNPEYAALQKQSTEFGTQQSIEGLRAKETANQIVASVEYRSTEQYSQLPENIRTNCLNRHELCSFWQVIGECENNKAYMQTNCAPACLSCHMIDIEARCPKLVDPDPALHPGDLNKMFERIVRHAPGNQTTLTDAYRRELADTLTPHYTVHVHSRPEPGATEISAALDKSMPPWVITFDNFVTDEECEAMIALGYEYGYKRSEDVGAQKFDGTHDSIQSTKRTSENAWCATFGGCRKHDVPTRLHDRMSAVMNIPANNSEDLQLLKYEVGQFYKTHHDYIPHQRDRQCGPRILTFFLYLSDVTQGGGTNFPQLDLTVEPKRGRALLWPSVLDSDPMAKDGRTVHQALSVEEGTKFAANGWIHMYDYVAPQATGCN